ncbi:MAG: 50S ribosomal protein L19 [Candidatus Omnitrophota bacterium]|nr:MAG: 50S ribosomal protein L19 [Candidatus Omnitrophota bacterium]
MIVEEQLRKNLNKEYPEFNQGDIVKVYYKIKEKERERIHPVEGIVIRTKGSMQKRSFTVRRLAYGEAYEVTFPYYSPHIDKVEVVKKSRRRPRRAKLYYLRRRAGKKAALT